MAHPGQTFRLVYTGAVSCIDKEQMYRQRNLQYNVRLEMVLCWSRQEGEDGIWIVFSFINTSQNIQQHQAKILLFKKKSECSISRFSSSLHVCLLCDCLHLSLSSLYLTHLLLNGIIPKLDPTF